MLTFVAL
jgi:hypothetical protein